MPIKAAEAARNDHATGSYCFAIAVVTENDLALDVLFLEIIWCFFPSTGTGPSSQLASNQRLRDFVGLTLASHG